MGILVDVIIILIVVLSMLLAYRKGLIALAIKLCAVVISIIVTLLLYRPVANFIINTTSIDETIQNAIYEKSYDLMFKKQDDSDLSSNLIEQATTGTLKQTSKELSIQIINACVILILFFGIKIALRFVSVLANAVAKLPILNKLNKIGGIIYGIIRGIVIVYTCMLLISFVGKIDNNNVLHKSIEKSSLGKAMYENNVFNILL